MYSVHLDTLGIIHDFQWIAAIYSYDIKKAEPFLTSRSLNVLKKSKKGLLVLTRQSFFLGKISFPAVIVNNSSQFYL